MLEILSAAVGLWLLIVAYRWKQRLPPDVPFTPNGFAITLATMTVSWVAFVAVKYVFLLAYYIHPF
ncbi:hypothetical protein [Methylobacterium sp. Leaf85]|uniref:hypothetical protein n=1 Tax=Methylobacterium sp. Leaf85 TaxID=1736241 RepID=UPI0006F4C846|nr:hypothetical protein [Methylobacterium sp. Leaf85]KQO49957.1 hypothetical protein ASF08_22740 [Methylobacterium sp. Leaf85]